MLCVGLLLLLGASVLMTLRVLRNVSVGVILAAIALDGVVLWEVFPLHPWLLGVLACGAGGFALTTVLAVSRGRAAPPPSLSVVGSLGRVGVAAGALCIILLYAYPRWDMALILVVSAGVCAASVAARRRRVTWWPASVAIPLAVVLIADLVFGLGASAQLGHLTTGRAIAAAAAAFLCVVSVPLMWTRDPGSSRDAVAVLACTVLIGAGMLFAVGLLAHGFRVTTPIASVRSPNGMWTLSIADVDEGGLGSGMSVRFGRDYLGLVQQEKTVEYAPLELGDRPAVHWLNAEEVDINGRLFSVSGN
jgi:hypothetical protein